MAVRDKLWNILLVNCGALRLPRIIGQFVWNTEPVEPVYNVLFKLRLVALFIGVLKAQEHHSPIVRGKKIVKKGRTHTPNMQKARRAWRKPRNNLLSHPKTIPNKPLFCLTDLA